MNYRVVLGVFLAVLAVRATPPPTYRYENHVLPREGISHGPLFLNEEDRKALLHVTQQATQHNKASPGEEIHGILEGLLKSAETASNILKKFMSNVQTHEEKSHNIIDELRSSDPDTTDVCVKDIFGTPTRSSPIYCAVKYFSQTAIGLYDMQLTIKPLTQFLQKLISDIAACREVTGLPDKFICNTQAYRDGWENSDYVRARLGQHLTVIRALVLDINECLKSNHEIQAHLVNKVVECTRASK